MSLYQRFCRFEFFLSISALCSIQLVSGSVLAEEKPIQFSGYFDSFYQHPFNGQLSASRRGFDSRNQVLQVQYAGLTINKEMGPASVTADLAFGEQVSLMGGLSHATSLTDAGSTTYEAHEPTNHITQAFLNYSFSESLKLTVGKFYTWVGQEGALAKDNWNYSRSLTFNWAIPLWHTGLGLSYSLLPQLKTSLYLVNGWDGRTQPTSSDNKSLTSGVQIAWDFAEASYLKYNFITGTESRSKDAARTVHNLAAQYRINPMFSLAAEYTMGVQKQSSGTNDANWSSIVAYFNTNFSETFRLALRHEIYEDKDGSTINGGGFFAFNQANKQTINSSTLTAGLQLGKGIESRLEYRMDKSDKSDINTYQDENALSKDSEQTASISILASF